MIVQISSDAEQDLAAGFWFYERQESGLGDYFRSALIAEIDSLAFYGGIHAQVSGYYRALAQRFPYAIYYLLHGDVVIVIAVLDARRSPAWIAERLAKKAPEGSSQE